MIKIYLATVYSGTPKQQEERFVKVNKIAADLMAKGFLVFSPISHTHPIALAGDLPKDWEFWKEYDSTFIKWADEIHVFMQDGWKKSTGVTAEIRIAKKLNKPVLFIEDANGLLP